MMHGEGILRCDGEGRIVEASALACVCMQRDRDALLSRRIEEIGPGLDRARRVLAEIPGLRALELKDAGVLGRPLRRELRLRLLEPEGPGLRTLLIRPARRRAADELPEDHDFVRALLDASPLLVAAADAQGRVVLFNRACERLTGRSFEELRGRPFWEVLPAPEHRESVREAFLGTPPERYPRRHESDWLTLAGERRRVEWTNQALLDDTGRLRVLLSVGREAAPAKPAYDARHLLAALVDCSVDAFVGLTGDGIVEAWNEAAARAFGYGAAEAVGRPIGFISFPGEEDVVRGFLEQALAGRCVE
ncbi:MAG TPA: PAS domain S-box protein, partial [Planctomycetota bacterium]|nr:PAS domain S-box protein [Planctomycetota bacterium]